MKSHLCGSAALFLLFALGFAFMQIVKAQATSNDPAAQLGSLRTAIQETLQPRLREAISQPSNPRNAQILEETKQMIDGIRHALDLPRMNEVCSADAYRMIAFLEVMLARLQGERVAYQTGPPGVDPNIEIASYATFALSDVKASRKHIDLARQPNSNIDPQWINWMISEDVPGHLLHLEAHAHAMLWKTGRGESERAAARAAWQAASLTPFGKKNTQPSPELANALALYRLGEDPHLMTTLVGIGVGLMLLAVVIAICVPRPTSFQMFVFRIVAALGAAGIGAVLPGFIGFKTASVTAGGAVALFVLIYLVNPPRLARNLAGN